MIRKHLSTIIKLGITILGLGLVFSRVDIRLVWQDIQAAIPFWLLISFILVNGSFVVRAYRWHILVVALGATIRFGRLVELYFASNFFNSILPSGIAGDVLRAVEAAQDIPPGTAVGTVLVDRATGLMALFALALVALPFRPDGFPALLLLQITAVCVIGLVGGFVVLEGRFVRRFGRWVPGRLRPLWAKLDLVLEAVEACGWPAIWAALGISIFFNLMQIGWWWAAGKALGYDINLTFYFLTTPLMSLATLLPSIGGLGIRELLATLLFTPIGLSVDEAVTLSLLVFAVERISGLLGAPIYMYSTIRQNREKRKRFPPRQDDIL